VTTRKRGKSFSLFLTHSPFRIASIKNLATISIALGKERTRNELLPYIMDLMDDDEEILIVMAEALNGSFLEYVGGPLFAPHLFKPLERLCELEETTVRNKAVESIKNIFSLVNIKDLKQQIIQMIERLMNGETYASKLAAI
jgi:serine/threonine-protein phosphatase 2A regulatory subunit A